MAVLDSSALIALLLGEPGADVVAAHLPGGVMCAVNLAEIAGFFARRGAMPDDVQQLLSALQLSVVAADEALSLTAGALVPKTSRAGLSLGDRYCLALAQQRGEPAVTADRLWRTIAPDLAIPLILIR